MPISKRYIRSLRLSRTLGLFFAVLIALGGGLYAAAEPDDDPDSASSVTEVESEPESSSIPSVSSNTESSPSEETPSQETASENTSSANTSSESTSSGKARKTDQSDVVAGLREIMKKYPSGSYFTKNGKACKSHPKYNGDKCDNCKTATDEEAGTEGNIQCFGFVRVVFYSVFGVPYPHYSRSVRWKVEGEEIGNVVLLWENAKGKYVNTSGAKKLFSKAAIGDIIHCGLDHSMVYLASTEDGVLVYDANYDLVHCEILVHFISWSQTVSWAVNYGMSIYRSANYLPGPSAGDTLDGFISEMLAIAPAFAPDVSESDSGSSYTGKTDFAEAEEPEKQIKSVSYPTKTVYLAGDPFVPNGASMVILNDSGEAVTYGPDRLIFNGFDSSSQGECLVTMEADGIVSAPFRITVIASDPEDPGDPAYSSRITPDVTIIIVISAAAAALLAFTLILRRRKSHRFR